MSMLSSSEERCVLNQCLPCFDRVCALQSASFSPNHKMWAGMLPSPAVHQMLGRPDGSATIDSWELMQQVGLAVAPMQTGCPSAAELTRCSDRDPLPDASGGARLCSGADPLPD